MFGAGELASADAQAVVLICTSIGSSRDEPALKPFGPRTWAKLETRLGQLGASPSSLLGLDARAIDATLEIGAADAERLTRLLGRAGQLAFELDRLWARGVWVVTLADSTYPTRLRERLPADRPPVLFGSGDVRMLDGGGLAIVGSRDADAAAIDFTERLAAATAEADAQVVSGGARGVDAWAMRSAFEAGGSVVGVLPEGVERRLRESVNRAALAGGRAVLVSPYRPDAPFSAGAAMARNKLIYALSDAAVIVSSATQTGGTWAGAFEALEAGWVPIFVRDGPQVPEGNRRLRDRGALSLAEAPIDSATVSTMLATRPPGRAPVAPVVPEAFEQGALFGE